MQRSKLQQYFIRIICTLVACSMIGNSAVVLVSADFAGEVAADVSPVANADDIPDYTQYLHQYIEELHPQQSIRLKASWYQSVSPAGAVEHMNEYHDVEDTLLLDKSAEALTYQFHVEQEGLYMLSIRHFPLETVTGSYEIAVRINGKTPFLQAESLTLNSVYSPADSGVITDSTGDQFAARRVVWQNWTTTTLSNPDRDYDQPLYFYLPQGETSLTLVLRARKPIVLDDILLWNRKEAPTYAEYRAKAANDSQTDEIFVEAEDCIRQSDSTVMPVAVHSDPLMSPYSAKNLLINCIGSTWSDQGQWLEWNIKVKTTGWYSLTFRYRQNSLKGLSVGRRLTIDGEIPFMEAEYISFPYSNSWTTMTVRDNDSQPYWFYLTQGDHTIRLETVLGQMADIIREVDDIVYDLNVLYRSVVMITTNTVDTYRDYQLDKEIPGLTEALNSAAARLDECNTRVIHLANGRRADSSILATASGQLKSMAKEPSTIPFRLTSWQSNIASISAWALDMRSQPLQMDYFVFTGQGKEPVRQQAGFLQKLRHTTLRFVYSFFKDYNRYRDPSSVPPLTLWLNTGRDQAEILWQMTTDLFTPQTGIPVDIKLVSATMVEAFLSGQTPDVAIQTSRDTPVNMAVRGALLDLTSFTGFDEVRSWFNEDALVPYTMGRGVYGLPDSQTFSMMFYRKDILNDLGIPIPTTWDEFVSVAHQLHLHKLEVGIGAEGDAGIFYALLMQQNGRLFKEDLSSTLLSGQTAISAFTQWTKLYSEVGLPISFNFYNRFRTGEMPLAIVPYTQYNLLASEAPEIRGLWGVSKIPGIAQPDGAIDRSQSATGTAAVILSSTKQPDAAWSFLYWWTGEAAQTRFSQEMEARLGVLGRVAVANKAAFQTFDYPNDIKAALWEQWEQVHELPQVPGNYYLDRDLQNAFRDVIYNSRNPQESILKYARRIDQEIQRKRKELGLG